MKKIMLLALAAVFLNGNLAHSKTLDDFLSTISRTEPKLCDEIKDLVKKSGRQKDAYKERNDEFKPTQAELWSLCFNAALLYDFDSDAISKNFPILSERSKIIGAIKVPHPMIIFRSNDEIVIYEKNGQEEKAWNSSLAGADILKSRLKLKCFQGHPYIEVTTKARRTGDEKYWTKVVNLVDFGSPDGAIVESKEIDFNDSPEGVETTDPDPDNKTVQWERAKPDFHFPETSNKPSLLETK